MNLDILTAISPIDGRYRGKTESLADPLSCSCRDRVFHYPL